MKLVTVKVKKIKVPESLAEFLSLTDKEKIALYAYEKKMKGEKLKGGA